MEKYLQIGKVVNTHGFKGDIKMQTWSDTPAVCTKLKALYRKVGNDYQKYNIQKSSVHKGHALIKFEGIDDFDSANLLRDVVFYADRNDIKINKDTFFIADLIGLEVIDVDTNVSYGKLKDVLQYGIHDIYVVSTEKGEVLMPAVNEFIKKISITEGIFIKPIEGMFDEV